MPEKLVIFGGTREGRELAQRLRKTRPVWVSVATGYGEELLFEGEHNNLFVHTGRMGPGEMEEFFRREGFSTAVDATHPYAREVSRTLREVCAGLGVRLLHLRREETDLSGFLLARDAGEAAALCATLPGNILLATGVKELSAFCREEGVRERLYPRVLPLGESLEQCKALGIPASRIIAIQGPFCKELNLALMKQYRIRVLVTKDGGPAGGMEEKLAAAREASVRVVAIRRPLEEETGYSEEELLGMLTSGEEGTR